MILEQYDEANGILDDIAGGIKSVVSSVIEWFKNIFK